MSAPLQKRALDFRVRRRARNRKSATGLRIEDASSCQRGANSRAKSAKNQKCAAGSRSNAFQDPAKNFQRLNARRFTSREEILASCARGMVQRALIPRAPLRHHPRQSRATVSR